MNAITKAVSECRYRIPKEVLGETFYEKRFDFNPTPASIDEQIKDRVIYSRVIPDCNLTGGVELLISIQGLATRMIDGFTTIVRVPKELTQGRSITSVLSIGFASPALSSSMGLIGNINPCSINVTGMAGMGMMDAMNTIPVSSTARVQLIGENTIMVKDVSPFFPYGLMRVVIENDVNMNHLQPRSIPAFCDLVVLAVKAFIYNTSIVEIDMAKLSGGQELGAIKSIIEGYADADELYREKLAKDFAAIQYMNDRETYSRFLRLMISGNR